MVVMILACHIFQIRLEHFVPMLVLFVQKLRTEKKNKLEILPLLRIDVSGPTVGTTMIQKNFTLLF